MPTSVVDAIVTRSDGIPIFAEELARSLQAMEDASPGTADATAIPVTLNEILLARLDLLEHGRETAQLAAAIGRDIPLDLLIAVSPFGEAATRASIERLVGSGIFVTRHSGFGDAVDFRHALLRDAAYHLLLRRDRLRVHRLIADTIEARFPAISDSMPHVLAHQFAEAGDHSAAVIYLERAGRDAARRSAASEAVAHFAAALEQTLRLPPGRERDEREFDLRLGILGPLIAASGYGASEVERQIAHAVELSAHIGAGDRIVPALFLNWIARFNETDVRFEVARQIAQVAAAGSTLDKLMAHRCMGTTLLFRGEFAAAIAEFEQFQNLFDPELHSEALNRIGATIHAVTVKVGLAEAWTVLGDAERAGFWREAALGDAEASGHYQTICHIDRLCRRPARRLPGRRRRPRLPRRATARFDAAARPALLAAACRPARRRRRHPPWRHRQGIPPGGARHGADDRRAATVADGLVRGVCRRLREGASAGGRACDARGHRRGSRNRRTLDRGRVSPLARPVAAAGRRQ